MATRTPPALLADGSGGCQAEASSIVVMSRPPLCAEDAVSIHLPATLHTSWLSANRCGCEGISGGQRAKTIRLYYIFSSCRSDHWLLIRIVAVIRRAIVALGVC
jgi:hypothetical protein